ncbi:glutamyl-tRNA reductase [Caldibacillus thermoamylovorans]|uniref:glutamyl-tRNA reductase n=1 Tax=Caldibacillus thermoamylovorans TaxID=35841 RepID=UPI00203EB636|nr:glutamyl-tRNA reductase [Caldibacillus thermoamylovorans]MCM3798047.1 glutamyl-tRNA reductase [Caldibacillus thermoamylovorans]
MYIITVGLNYKTAPVEIRERLSFQEAELTAAMVTLKKRKSILENVIVSTCNRTEIYAVVDQLHTGRYYIKEFLAEWFHIEREQFESHLYIYENQKAVEHLFNVSCGLDSMVIGETQILGQVRSSFFKAQESNSVGTVFNQLFKQAITVAKKAHTETDISSNAVSVSYAAVELAKKIFGQLHNKHILIIGAGKMGKITIQNLLGSGAGKISVVNRTVEKAMDLAKEIGGKAYSLESLPSCLTKADIVISSTGSNHYVIHAEMMATVEKMRKGRPMLFIDIAVPRDIDPEIDQFESVFLYDIDDLEGVVEANLQERQRAATKIQSFITDEIAIFQDWVNTLGVVPLISSLREKALTIQADVMTSLERKLPDLTERERKIIGKHMKSIINQMLKDPILQIKELAAGPEGEQALHYFEQIFQLEAHKEKQMEESQHERIDERKTRSLESYVNG